MAELGSWYFASRFLKTANDLTLNTIIAVLRSAMIYKTSNGAAHDFMNAVVGSDSLLGAVCFITCFVGEVGFATCNSMLDPATTQ